MNLPVPASAPARVCHLATRDMSLASDQYHIPATKPPTHSATLPTDIALLHGRASYAKRGRYPVLQTGLIPVFMAAAGAALRFFAGQ